MTQTYSRRKHSVTHHNPVLAYSGFTLLSPFGTDDAWLIDMKGQTVHHWKMPGFSCELLPDGHLLGITREGLLELDWDGNFAWSYKDEKAKKHFCRLDNGNTIYLRRIPVPADIAVKVKGGIAGTEKGGMVVDALSEVNPSGKLIWEWLGYEHLDSEEDAICPVCHRDNWTDSESFAVMADGNILASFSGTHMLYVIDKETGKIKWRWGLKELAHPSQVAVLGNGNFLVFDTGLHPYGVLTFSFSRILEIDPRGNRMVWDYKDPAFQFFYSAFMGGCQRLANGNTLITESQTGRIFEIAGDNKEIVWEFVNPHYSNHPLYGHNNIVFRAYRYSPEYPGIKGRL